MNTNMLEDDIKSALTEVVDPETRLSIMRMGVIKDLKVGDEGEVSVVFRPASPTCPMAYGLANNIKMKIASVKGVKSVVLKVENFSKAGHLESVINS